MDVHEFLRNADAQKAARAEQMPTEHDCLRVMMQAYLRMKELGWNDAIYCPKDGSVFHAIEAGSTGIGTCHYSGEWPDGSWWMHDAGDLWPSRPILFKAINTKYSTPPTSTEAGYADLVTMTMTRLSDGLEQLHEGLRKANRDYDVEHLIHQILELRAIVAQHMPKEGK